MLYLCDLGICIFTPQTWDEVRDESRKRLAGLAYKGKPIIKPRNGA